MAIRQWHLDVLIDCNICGINIDLNYNEEELYFILNLEGKIKSIIDKRTASFHFCSRCCNQLEYELGIRRFRNEE